MNGSGAFVRRVGFMMPSVNIVLENDLRRILPTDVSAHVARVQWHPHQAPDELVAVRRIAAEQLRDARPAVVGFACSSETMVSAEETEQVLAGFADLLSVPIVAAGPALVDRLRRDGATRIAVLTPLAEIEAEHELRFLEDSGFHIVESKVLGIADPGIVAGFAPADIAEEVTSWADAPIDAAVILCATYRGAEAAALLRARMPVPVISINEVTIDATLEAYPSQQIGEAA